MSMGRKSVEEEGRETSSSSSWFAYSPWYFLQQVAEVLLCCLGFRRSGDVEGATDLQPDPKSTKKEIEVGSRSIARAARRPPRPPVSSGGGGKTN